MVVTKIAVLTCIWKIESKEEYDTGRKHLTDVTDEEYKIEKSEEEKYLGDLITSNGKNTNNIKARKCKGIGIINQIFSILNEVFFGPYYFQVAMMLRSSLFLNSILLNSESWYNLSNADFQELEAVDHMLLRRILETSKSTPLCILHLELGTIGIRHVIKVVVLCFYSTY